MEITLEPTKKAVSQFRDLWNSPSVISPSKQSHDSVALELVMINAYKFSINLGKVYAFDQLGVVYGSFIPPFSSGIDARKSFYPSVSFPLTADEIEALNKRYLGVIKV